MFPRKPTVDDVDDTDDQDGVLDDQKQEESDLKLQRRDADDVALGGTGSDGEPSERRS
jgi:hypothetical protein